MQYRINKANAREMAARAHAVMRDKAAQRELKLQEAMKSPEPGQARLSRLWASLAVIDERVAVELARERPNLALVKELSVISRSFQSQALELKPASQGKRTVAAPADLPEPTA